MRDARLAVALLATLAAPATPSVAEVRATTFRSAALGREVACAVHLPGAVSEFVLVAVDGGNSFFSNSPLGRYEDLVTQDAIVFAESSYRVRRDRAYEYVRPVLALSVEFLSKPLRSR